jgi:NAD(P)-dependent dehydrogenase (short-subunit alcohol dehydrogenase family)
MASKESALIVGVGPALGAALARRFAGDGMAVALAARKTGTVEALAKEIGGKAYACDATEEDQVEALFEAVGTDLGAPDLVVFNAGTFSMMSVLETPADHFEQSWKINCLGGFFVGRAAAAAMRAKGSGTIIFTGATASLRGGARFHNLAVGKFGLRALAQSMARELGRENIHVAHVIIDGVIDTERGRAMMKDAGPDGLLAPDAIAANYLHLHRQPRSAWTHELDLRPWAERF